MKVILMIAAILVPSLSYGQLADNEPITLDLQDHKIQFASDAINKYLQAQDSNTKPQHAIQVMKAIMTVVSGRIYHLKIKLEADDGLKTICDVKIWEQVWMNPSLKSLNVSCKPEMIYGGPEPADFNDAMVKQALSFLTDRFNQVGNFPYRSVRRGGSVTRQTVLGYIYRFKNLDMMESICKNTEENQGKFTTEQCPIKDNAIMYIGRVNAKVYWDHKKFSLQGMDILE